MGIFDALDALLFKFFKMDDEQESHPKEQPQYETVFTKTCHYCKGLGFLWYDSDHRFLNSDATVDLSTHTQGGGLYKCPDGSYEQIMESRHTSNWYYRKKCGFCAGTGEIVTGKKKNYKKQHHKNR